MDVKPKKGDKGPEKKASKSEKLKEEVKMCQENAITNPEASPQKKKKQAQNSMALVHTLPKNIEEQQEIFFENDCKVNPQFEYENYALTQNFLKQYKEPSSEFIETAIKIMDSFVKEFGSESLYLETEGEVISQEETETIFQNYIDELEFTDQLIINFTRKQVAPTSVTHDPKTGKSKVNVRLPCEYRRGRILGVLDHEIGTHYLRRHNEKLQVWYKKRQKYEMKTCIMTEEGFACTNQMVRTALEGKAPYLYRSALNYYAALQASKMSFVELFDDIAKYIDDKMRRFKFVVRLKRGLRDTGEPGGLYKDQVYLKGAVLLLQDRNNLDWEGLCSGKISLEDLRKPHIQKKIRREELIIPPFM